LDLCPSLFAYATSDSKGTFKKQSHQQQMRLPLTVIPLKPFYQKFQVGSLT